MRSASVSFAAERSTKSWIGTAMSGEGLLNVYKGRGRVWLAPTQPIYERMARAGLTAAAGAGRPEGTQQPAR